VRLEDLSARQLLEALPDAALVIERDGRILAGNGRANQLLATEASPTDASILEFLPEQERRRLNPLEWLRRWAEAPEAPELTHVRLWCRDRNGRDKAVRVRVGTLPTEPAGYLVMLTDVTEEQARQYHTRSAHRLAARVLAISADAIVNVDESLAIVYANPSAERLFGHAPGTLIGQPLAELLPARFRHIHEDVMRRFAAEPSPSRLMGQRAEICGLTAEGEEIPLEASITKVTTDRGLIFSAHLRDLRPRKATEAALAGIRARLQTVFEHASQAMALVDPDGRVEAMNAAGRDLLAKHVDPVGRYFVNLLFFSGNARATVAELSRAIAGAAAGEAYRTTAEVRLPDGSERRLWLVFSPVTADYAAPAVIVEAFDLAGAAS